MGLFVTDYIRPVSLQDKYPTHLDIFGKGGIHGVDTLIARNNITSARRREGMLCFVKEDNSYYALLGGVDNENWIRISTFSDGHLNFILPLKHGYIYVGDKDGLARPSPLLIDVRQDIIDLRRNLSKVSNLETLGYKKLWTGNSKNEVIEVQQIDITNLPPLNATQLSIGPITYGIWEMWQGTNSGAVETGYAVSIELMKQQYLRRFGKFVMNSSSGLIPFVTGYEGAQYLDLLPQNRILTHTTEGTIGVASLTQDHLWKGDGNNVPVEVLTIAVANFPDLTYKAIWRGNATNRPEETQDLTILEAKVTYIQDVTIPALEAQIEALQTQVTAIEGQIAVIQGQISLLEAAVAVIQGQIITILATLGDHGNRITTLENKVNQIQQDIIAINARIDALSITLVGDVTGSGDLSSPITTTLQLTLDQIKLAQDTVNLNDHRISNLKNTVNDTTNAISFEVMVALLTWTAEEEWLA
jgi:predicted  nucleic acid-binding Zn-ribbon protein